MDNVLNNIGDILSIHLEPKMSGKIRITSFTDSVTGETSTRTLLREFRISQDGLFWSDWAVLTNDNLDSEEYIVDNSLFIELRYTRTGTDNTGTIVFNDIDFNGTCVALPFEAPTLFSSILSDAVGTDELSALERNLFKKLYYRGIIANYVHRGDNDDYKEDKDFVDLYYSVARFYALFIIFFKRWENFRNDFDLLREQVRGYGLYFDESSITLEELQYLTQNLFSQAQQRGTQMIFKHKGDALPGAVTPAPIDGEFIRLIRSKKSDELLYEEIPVWKSGWCMRQSSPLYRGTARSYNLNKTKENTEDFQNLNNFVLSKSSSGASYTLASVGDKKVLRLSITTGGKTVGLGRIDTATEVDENLYAADSQMDYEITFAFRIVSASALNAVTLHFGVEGFDVNKDLLLDAFVNPNGGSVNSEFISQSMNIWKTGVWYFARGIIHAYSSVNVDEEIKTNLGVGHDLYFNNSFIKYILPKIQISTSSGSATVDIWDYKIRPLVRGKNILPLKNVVRDSFSLGFVQSSKIFHTYFRNNNNSQSQDEITNIIEKYLYPFNSIDVFTIMSNN